MTENITISLWEYNELMKNVERIAAVKRMVEYSDYVSIGDIKSVLGIKTAIKGGENGTI